VLFFSSFVPFFSISYLIPNGYFKVLLHGVAITIRETTAKGSIDNHHRRHISEGVKKKFSGKLFSHGSKLLFSSRKFRGEDREREREIPSSFK
jgi:hypothetical protein